MTCPICQRLPVRPAVPRPAPVCATRSAVQLVPGAAGARPALAAAVEVVLPAMVVLAV